MAKQWNRTRYWELTNGKWLLREGFESEDQALARYIASPSLAIDQPQGAIQDGVVDSHTIYTIKGWALDPRNDKVSPTVEIWLNNVVVARVLCNVPRPDVADKYGIDGFNIFGFEYVVPQQHQNPSATLRVTVDGWENNFVGTPAALDQGSSTTSGTTIATTVQPDLTFQIVDYKTATGYLQYKINGGTPGLPITIDLPILRGTIEAGFLYTYLFPSGQRSGTNIVGTAKQSGKTLNINFTTGSSIETP